MEQHGAHIRRQNNRPPNDRQPTNRQPDPGDPDYAPPRLPHPTRGGAGRGWPDADEEAEAEAVYRAPRRGAAAAPSGAVVSRPSTVARIARLPQSQPRLTGLGTGLLTTAVALLGGWADATLFDGPGTLFGVVFVVVCAAAGLYVRRSDLVAAPVSAPIAFAVAIVVTGDDGGGGLIGHLLGLFTALALLTGWLYTGTVLAAVIVGVRALLRPSRRRQSPRCSGDPQGRSRR